MSPSRTRPRPPKRSVGAPADRARKHADRSTGRRIGTSTELSPVLLLGAGTGEASCGILYLASFLRRHGIEAFVRLNDDDDSEAAIEQSLRQLLERVRPKLVGISLKWFHHLARAKLLAETIRALDPGVKIVLGGNTAAYYWRELSLWDCVDEVVLGDGEVPLLALCRNEPNPPNVVTRNRAGAPDRLPLTYVQGTKSAEVHYSHFDALFLSRMDLHRFSGWVAPGKGCGENCLYCGGTRGVQEASFGRPKSFLRPVESVQLDHREVVPRSWQLRYDFSGSSAEFLSRIWKGLDLSAHATTYFLWGVPPSDLVEALAGAFGRVFLVLDIGCFSETQRTEQQKRGLLKPCPTDAQLFHVLDHCARFPNLKVEVSGIAGLPFASARTLQEERALMERLFERGCVVGYQRLEAQPGALVTEHPDRFGMVAEARTFDEFLRYFDACGAAGEGAGAHYGAVPMVRYRDAALERAVQETFEELDEQAHAQAEAAAHTELDDRTRLVDVTLGRLEMTVGEWLGSHQVPTRAAQEPVTVLRGRDGLGLACAPGLSPRRFAHPSLQQGSDAALMLEAMALFRRPTRVLDAVAKLHQRTKLDGESSRELVAHLVAGRFLQPG